MSMQQVSRKTIWCVFAVNCYAQDKPLAALSTKLHVVSMAAQHDTYRPTILIVDSINT